MKWLELHFSFLVNCDTTKLILHNFWACAWRFYMRISNFWDTPMTVILMFMTDVMSRLLYINLWSLIWYKYLWIWRYVLSIFIWVHLIVLFLFIIWFMNIRYLCMILVKMLVKISIRYLHTNHDCQKLEPWHIYILGSD